MSQCANMSVRGLLYLLMGSAIFPAFTLLAVSVYHQYQSDERAAAAAAHDLAQLAADNVQSVLADSRNVLSKIAARPDVRSGSEGHCAVVFQEFKDLYPQFSNLSQSSPGGYIVCSTTAQNTPTYVGDAQWFKQVFAGKSFIVAPPYLGPVTKRVVAVLAHPVVNQAGDMVGSVQMPIDLARFRVIPGGEKLPESTVITIFNTEGVLIARSRDAENFVGKNFSGTAAVELFLRQR